MDETRKEVSFHVETSIKISKKFLEERCKTFISHSDYDLIISIHREPGNSKSRIVKDRSHPRNRNKCTNREKKKTEK